MINAQRAGGAYTRHGYGRPGVSKNPFGAILSAGEES